MEDEKRYPIQEEEDSVGMASEPVGGYIATGSGYVSTIDDPMEEDEDCGISDDWDPGIGPYTMEELNARIDEADAAIDRAEAGDMSDWVTSEEMDRRLYERFPWLR